MLASLLPGVRELRSPLAAGYVWLAALWLLFHDRVPESEDEATGAWEAIFALGDRVSTVAIGVAVSFAGGWRPRSQSRSCRPTSIAGGRCRGTASGRWT